MKKVSLFLFGLAFAFFILPLGVIAESCTGALTGLPGACVPSDAACVSPNQTDGRSCSDPATPICCVFFNSGGGPGGATCKAGTETGVCKDNIVCGSSNGTPKLSADCTGASEYCCIPKAPATCTGGQCKSVAQCTTDKGTPNVACAASCPSGSAQVYCMPASTGGGGGGGTGGGGTGGGGTGGSTSFTNPLNFNTVEQVLGSILLWLRGIIVALALVFIVIGAVLYVTSAGNDKQIELGKNAILAAMIGLALGIAAPSFLLEISTMLGWRTPTGIGDPLSLAEILLNVLNFLLGIIGVLAIIMLVVGGIMYLTSAGDEKRIETGKKIVIWSIVGITVALSALIIVRQISSFF